VKSGGISKLGGVAGGGRMGMNAAQLTDLLDLQRKAYRADMDPSIQTRLGRLDRLAAMTEQHGDAIAAAISADFGARSRHETELVEIVTVLASVRHARRHLKRWLKPRRAPTALQYRPGRNMILRQPLGIVGIVSPWNYPYQLALGPAIAALAAGNRAMLKPSELTPRLSALLARIVADRFAPDEFAIVTGDASVGKAFSELPFDHLLFTGSTATGRLVAQAAARNLTPVTLELGGKSPAILDPSCDLDRAARSIAFGKLLNAGQTCIAPDYALVSRAQIEPFAQKLRQAIARLYPTLARNPDYTGIVSDRHRERLAALLADAEAQGARVIAVNPAGEAFDPATRKLAPTLVLGATRRMKLMQEEIFGPILPIIAYDAIEDALAYVNDGERPLALYWFGEDAGRRDHMLRHTISGGVTINDCLMHFSQEDQPFGGIGASGTGAYHGEWGFRTFSKEKPVFVQSKFNGLPLLYPPYGRTFARMIGLLRKIG
jgi:coniferyl-aldehyde dehydrogenase